MRTTPMQPAWITAYQQPVDDVLTTLDTDAQRGLSARKRGCVSTDMARTSSRQRSPSLAGGNSSPSFTMRSLSCC